MAFLHPQDVVVVLKLAIDREKKWTYAELGKELFMSVSQVFRSVARAEASRLLYPPTSPPRSGLKHSYLSIPNLANLKEFLIHGVKYSFPAKRGGMTRGIPTAYAASPLTKQIVPSSEPPPVWPAAEGEVRGTELSPLYKNAPQAALRDPRLYEALALIDAIREGRAREREIAIRELKRRIDGGS